MSGIVSVFIPDSWPKYRTVRYNTGHLATLLWNNLYYTLKLLQVKSSIQIFKLERVTRRDNRRMTPHYGRKADASVQSDFKTEINLTTFELTHSASRRYQHLHERVPWRPAGRGGPRFFSGGAIFLWFV